VKNPSLWGALFWVLLIGFFVVLFTVEDDAWALPLLIAAAAATWIEYSLDPEMWRKKFWQRG
jgi:hypothetical protein